MTNLERSSSRDANLTQLANRVTLLTFAAASAIIATLVALRPAVARDADGLARAGAAALLAITAAALLALRLARARLRRARRRVEPSV